MGIAGIITLVVILFVFVAGLIGYIISIYNSLIQVKNNIIKAWENIDVLLMQRHDELPKLIDTVKAYMKHEREVLNKLTELRVGYSEAETTDEKTRIENELNKEIASLRHVWEGYPDLKSSQNFLQIQDRVSTVESKIADRREFFNDSVNIYNIQIERFPERILARAMNYKRHPFLEAPDEKKQDVKMDFS